MDEIGFRPLQLSDLPLLHRWLGEPHVSRWWSYEESRPALSYDKVVAKYTPSITGEEPSRPFVVLYGDNPIGYIQTYMIADYPEYSRYVDEDEDAAGVDVFIGEIDYAHRGLGSLIIRKFLQEVVFAESDAVSCIIGPEPENKVAIRAYEKAGFRYLKTVHVREEPHEEYLMCIARVDVVG